ncbi:serine/threonine-protein kinase CHEK1 [Enteropsectra breve]|nr:serine/threonine-protein kinase CHEK1 [Enteropsectra breve]
MDSGSTIDNGPTSKVKKVVIDGKTHAIKIMYLRTRDEAKIQREIKIHRFLKSKRIVRFIKSFQNPDSYSILMDFEPFCLHTLIHNALGLSPQIVHMLFVQLIDALKFIHSKNICHRDIKPENLLVSYSGNLKLADFGYSTVLRQDSEPIRCTGTAGSYQYMAPEVFRRDYDGSAADVWSAGITLINMFTAKLPWDSAVPSDKLYTQYLEAKLHYYEPFSQIRKSTVQLIENMLAVESKRYTLSDICKDQWFSQSNQLLDSKNDCTDSSFLVGIYTVEQENLYSQPERARPAANEKYISSSMPHQTTSFPVFYRSYINGNEDDVLKFFEQKFAQLKIGYETCDNIICFSTTDTQRNKLVGQLSVHQMSKRCLVTIKKTQGNSVEFKKMVVCLETLIEKNRKK